MVLRLYQQHALDRLFDAISKNSRAHPLLVAPTGSGKTNIAAALINQMEDEHVLFLAHRRELIHQARTRLLEAGVKADDIGLILAGEEPNDFARVQVAAVQTLWARRRHSKLPPAGVITVDEAHHCRARTYQALIDAYPGAAIIGMTATPCRSDGRGLGTVFDTMIQTPQVAELIKLGFLVPTLVYAPRAVDLPDLAGVHTVAGDYNKGELATRVNKPKLVGDIVSHWHRHAKGLKSVCFGVDVAHSRHICAEFVRSGVRAEHIDGDTPKPERDEILDRLSCGELELVTNCNILVEGWDQPDVACVIMARPTKSMGLHRQMGGRGLRPHPESGKRRLVILDHAGNVYRHGLIEDPVTWSLDEDTKALATAQAWRERMGKDLTSCSQCGAIRKAGEPCPACGYQPRRPHRDVEVVDGELARLDGQKADVIDPMQRRTALSMLAHVAQERGYKWGWVSHAYKDMFSTWPPPAWSQSTVTPIPPNAEVRAWCWRKRVAYAKQKEHERV